MNRLFTFGCSYTSYATVTYADILCHQYKFSKNFGQPGAGNVFINESFQRAFYEYGINSNDTVIIQWSSLLREDRFPAIPTKVMEYHLGGQVDNNFHLPYNFDKTSFNPIQQLHLLLHNINLISNLQARVGFKLKFIYMFEPWIEDFFGEPCHVSSHIKNKWILKYKSDSRLAELKNLKKSSEYFDLPSIESFCMNNPKAQESFFLSPSSLDSNPSYHLEADTHPSVHQHYEYAKLVANTLNIQLKNINIELLDDMNKYFADGNRKLDVGIENAIRQEYIDLYQ